MPSSENIAAQKVATFPQWKDGYCPDPDHPLDPANTREFAFARLMSRLVHLYHIHEMLLYVVKQMNRPGSQPGLAYPIFSYANLPWNFDDTDVSIDELMRKNTNSTAVREVALDPEEAWWWMTTDVTPSVELPVPQIQCGPRHWDEIERWATDLKIALKNMFEDKELSEEEKNLSEEERNKLAMPQLLGQLQRDVVWLAHLVNSGASLCAVMSDFAYSPGARPSRMLSHISHTLLRIKSDLNELATTLARENDKNGEHRISEKENEMFKTLRARFEGQPVSVPNPRILTTKDIADMCGCSPETVRRTIKKIEAATKKGKTNILGRTPEQKRWEYTLDEAKAIRDYHHIQPGRWKNRGQSKPK